MDKEVIIIGAGLSGLTCGALLSKKGLKVKIVDSQYKPGGSCGIFKRKDNIFEQGAAMIYGFGEKGFNPHRFVFNALEEPIDIIKHEHLYAINYGEEKIIFYEDIDKFIDELTRIFPKDRDNFKRFYGDMERQYLRIIAEKSVYVSPDVVKKEEGLDQLLRYPLDYFKFLRYMNINTEKLLKKYFKNEEVLKFFNKLTSTYCYTTVKETPAVLSSIMFVDNHIGGSYYPAGSTLNLVGKLEKVIEENNGRLIYNKEVVKILSENGKVLGVKLDDGAEMKSDYVVSSGTVWNLYNNLISDVADKKTKENVNNLVKTYPSVVLFALVKDDAIDKKTLPVEMLVSSKEKIDEGELTVYILSIDDKTLCEEGYHTIMAIGPTFKEWPKGFKNKYRSKEYNEAKEKEIERILNVLENRFKGFKDNVIHAELSTPSTLERYVMKEGGAVAGPKQKLGQHMLKRLKTTGVIKGLYHCGESTIMGTGTPAVTVSGISATNMILRDLGIEEYKYKDDMKNYVNIVKKGFSEKDIKIGTTELEFQIQKLASKCQYCEYPPCEKKCPYNIPIMGINRRVAVGNFVGAKNKLINLEDKCNMCKDKACEKVCIRKTFSEAVEIREIIIDLTKK